MRALNPQDFWAKTEPDTNGGCVLWSGPQIWNGYGRAKFRGRQVLAHRLAYELERGEPGGAQVLHRCDVRACVNPAHLFLGTALDNMRDKMAKGRHRTSLHRAKISAADAAAIREAVARSETQGGAGARYGLTQQTVSRIVARKIWA